MESLRFGFVAIRFTGTDGVSLEAEKWAQALEAEGHQVCWFAGELDERRQRHGVLEPRAALDHPSNQRIAAEAFSPGPKADAVTGEVEEASGQLERSLEGFVASQGVDVLVIQNASAIPMHIPLGLAVARYVKRSGCPTIAHHHDFAWERDRFRSPAWPAYMQEAFPPANANVAHVVINSEAGRAFRERTGENATVVPNVMPFEWAPDQPSADHVRQVRNNLGYSPDDVIVLQPTRVVPRKNIEAAVELVRRLGRPEVKLLVSHKAGDEGLDYAVRLRRLAEEGGVDLRFLGERFDDVADGGNSGSVRYSLADAYAICDFVTYPSLVEGFGNALLETIYYRKPFLINRYPVYREDIEPLGLRAVTMDSEITAETVDQVERVLGDPALAQAWAEENFALAKKHFGFMALRKLLAGLVQESLDKCKSSKS